MSKLLRLFAIFVIVAVAASAWAEEAAAPHYRLKVVAEPAAHRLEVEAWVQNPGASRFYLYKGFTVTSVDADGKPAAFRTDASAPPLGYAQPVVSTAFDGPAPKELHIKYSGTMPELVAGVNTVSADLVELSCYSSWFPGLSGVRGYEYELELNLPQGFVAATNGTLKLQVTEKGRAITSWVSIKRGFDIPVVASPKLKKFDREVGGTRLEIFASSEIPESVLRDEADGLAEEMRLFSILYGPPAVKDVVRVIYSPRDGWGYSRIPASIVSEGRARERLMSEAGEAREFRENAHEVAHFWWGFTGNDSTDNWIDEGLAEYSAFRMTSERYGLGFNIFQVGQYLRRIRTAKLSYAIAETPANTFEREINRYDRAALMFLDAEQRFGRTKLDSTLRAIRTKFKSGTPATTAAFLEEVKKQMGTDAEAFFREELYRKPTNEPVLKPASDK